MKQNRKSKRTALPGFGLSLGFVLIYSSLLVMIPLVMVFINSSQMGWSGFWEAVSTPRVLAAYKLSFLTAFFAAVVNAVFGLLITWVLVRYSFPGKRLIDALIDLPFALPTAVAGIVLTTLYAPQGWIGQFFPFKIAFSQIGIVVALIFIGIPFVVRMVQPVLQNFDQQVEEAAASLGAGRWTTIAKVIFPELLPSLLAGFGLAFARAIGEYGSVIFIAGNMPMKTEIAPLLIMTKLEQYDYAGATAIAAVMLVVSFLILLMINFLQMHVSKRVQGKGV